MDDLTREYLLKALHSLEFAAHDLAAAGMSTDWIVPRIHDLRTILGIING